MVGMSVIIPVHNCEKYLEQCIKSLMLQSPDSEFIFIDDASRDRSGLILKQYERKDRRIRIICNEKNIGAALSRNKGIETAAGKYVMFLDADDYLEKDAIETIYQYMSEYQADLCYIKMKLFYEGVVPQEAQEGVLGVYPGVYTGRDIIKEFIDKREFFMYLCSVCYRREFLIDNKLRFYSMQVGEGGEFILKALLCADKVSVIDQVLYFYRIHNTSVTHKADFKKELLYGQVRQYFTMLDYFAKNPDSETGNLAVNYLHKKMIGGLRKNTGADNLAIEERLDNHYQKYLFSLLTNDNGCYNIDLAPYLDKIQTKGKIIIYGAGYAAEELLHELNKYNIEIIGFAVTQNNGSQKSIFGHHIYEIDELSAYKEEAVVLIAANKKYEREIAHTLNEKGFRNYLSLEVEI